MVVCNPDSCSQVVFEQNRHEDALDLVCVQCEPDSPDYIRVRTWSACVKNSFTAVKTSIQTILYLKK